MTMTSFIDFVSFSFICARSRSYARRLEAMFVSLFINGTVEASHLENKIVHDSLPPYWTVFKPSEKY